MQHTMMAEGTKRGGTPTNKTKWIVIACAIYLVFPFDLLPDAIPLVGELDDLGAFLLAIRTVKSAMRAEGSGAQ